MSATADQDKLAGLVMAVAIVVVLCALGLFVFGPPPEQDCVRERHGKGAYTMRCVAR